MIRCFRAFYNISLACSLIGDMAGSQNLDTLVSLYRIFSVVTQVTLWLVVLGSWVQHFQQDPGWSVAAWPWQQPHRDKAQLGQGWCLGRMKGTLLWQHEDVNRGRGKALASVNKMVILILSQILLTNSKTEIISAVLMLTFSSTLSDIATMMSERRGTLDRIAEYCWLHHLQP